MLGLASIAAWYSIGATNLVWQSALWPQRPWTLWSAALVHLSGAHLLANLLALLVLAVLGACLSAGRNATLALLLAWPLSTLVLLWWPQITSYSGMSGLLNAMAAVLCAHTALRSDTKPVSWVIFAALAFKLVSEHAWSQPIAFDPNWGFNVVYAAHLAGAVAGAFCGLVFESAMKAAKKTPA